MIITTTPGVEGKRIVRYCGIVNGEAVVDAKLFRNMLGMRKPTASFEKAFHDAKDMAIDQMRSQAVALNANAIVGVHLNNEAIQTTRIMVSANGTAVRLE